MTAVIRFAEASFAAWIMNSELHQVPVDGRRSPSGR